MTAALITYREGVWLVDTHLGRVGQVMGNDDHHVQLRPPGSGLVWDADPEGLRLATADERKQVGAEGQGHPADARTPFVVGQDGITVRGGHP
ncbi:hypothetical protein ACH427_30035 [Streptomyces sp. NPDC020379]|uniref:hypothetical protein n=1 Tax=Streptomyces sp. NPDC020379 TaxID=3365071 RepID=UPI003795B222